MAVKKYVPKILFFVGKRVTVGTDCAGAAATTSARTAQSQDGRRDGAGAYQLDEDTFFLCQHILHRESLNTDQAAAAMKFMMVLPKPFANKPSHTMCCHLAIGAGTKILPIQ